MPVLHPEALGNGADLPETKALVQVARMNVCGHHRVELKNAEPGGFALLQRVHHKLLADVQPAGRRRNSVARVADMPAPPHIVGVENVHPQHRSGLVYRNAAVGLLPEERSSGFLGEGLLLREGKALLNHLIPDAHHGAHIRIPIRSHCDVHRSTSLASACSPS